MSNSEGERIVRGAAGMLHPRRLIGQLRPAYAPRFGAAFASDMVRGAVTVLVGGYVMVAGLLAMLIGGIFALLATGSLPAVTNALYVGFGIIIVGFVINGVGVGVRNRAIRAMSSQIIAFDPKVTVEGAARLIQTPQLWDRFTVQHPGFEPRGL